MIQRASQISTAVEVATGKDVVIKKMDFAQLPRKVVIHACTYRHYRIDFVYISIKL